VPQGDKSAYTSKQKRQAEHIEEGYKERGVSEDEAESRAWATVNKQTGGGRQSGSGRKGGELHVSKREEHQRRSDAAKKGWATRRKKSGS
jgi:plasmid stabilization system protein ParE